MKVTDDNNPKRFDNLSKEDLESVQDKAKVVCKSVEVRDKMSKSAAIRHFRDKNTDISVLMDYYKDGDQLQAIAKYMADNEKFIILFNDAEDSKEKADILNKYMTFQLRMHELMFGTKTKTMNLNVNVDSAKSMSDIYEECKEDNDKNK